jgi:phosphoribosylglycinamide formyltransferase-1
VADLVVMASGSGSNFEAIALSARGAGHTVLALICDNTKAYALERAERLDIPSAVFEYRAGRADAEVRIAEYLESLGPDIIALAGFMRILPGRIVDLFPNRIVNVHPSLLPDSPGTHAIERTYSGGGAMGVTVHIVDHGVDTGPVLVQEEVERPPGATLQDMEARIHETEHRIFPAAVVSLLNAARSGVHA